MTHCCKHDPFVEDNEILSASLQKEERKPVECLSVLQLELDRFLTLHLRSRKFPSIAAYIETVRVLAELSDRVAGRPSPHLPRPKVGLAPLQAILYVNMIATRSYLFHFCVGFSECGFKVWASGFWEGVSTVIKTQQKHHDGIRAWIP